MRNRDKSTTPFTIDHLDPLAQGVSRFHDKPIFIPKTLPGESGTCQIYKKAKGVIFAYPLSQSDLSKRSSIRTMPDCPHYETCSGCHYLHTSYAEEMNFKRLALLRHLKKINPNDLSPHIHAAPNRFHYRNRIQLHYHKKLKKLGYIDRFSNQILEVPNCLLPSPSIAEKIKEIYSDNNFFSSLPTETGHLEIYELDNKLNLHFNSPYAASGFTQVNVEMNLKLKELVQSQFPAVLNTLSIIELFGGDGNLSATLPFHQCWVVDSFPHKNMSHPRQKFVQTDLFSDDSIEVLKAQIRGESVDALIVDPPRSGFDKLSSVVDLFEPQLILYVSCNAATLNRDIYPLSAHYEISQIHLIDLFPGTHHFETLLILKKRAE